jgi:hypothetical protein
LLPDLGSPGEALWFSCSQILSTLFRLFGTKSGSKKTKGPKQDSQNLGARKAKGLNRILALAILLRPFGFLALRFCLSCLCPLVFLLPDFVYSV